MHEIIWQHFADYLLQLLDLVVVQVILPIIALSLAGYGTIVLRKLGLASDARTKLAMQRGVLDLLDRGVQFADTYAHDQIAKAGPIESNDPRIAALANFIITQAPNRLKKLGYDPNTLEGQKAIVQLAMAHLPPPAEPNSAAPAVK